MNDFPVLTSTRIRLREFSLFDATVVQQLAGDFRIADTTLAIPHPYPDGTAEAWISTHESEFAMGTAIHWAIERLSDTRFLGAVSLVNISPESEKAEIGYWIGVPYWGQGYCTEAARAVLAYAFDELQLNRVYAYHFLRNPASGRVMQKLGMKKEGELRQHFKHWDVFEDVAIYGILRSEFLPQGDH